MNTPLQKALRTDKHFFEILVENNFLDDFQTFMSNYRLDRAEFLDVYPAETQLLPGGPKSDIEVLMVDVGGGDGHEIELFIKTFPEKKGRMILQDQPNIVGEVKSETFEVMGYDFFKPQPIKGEVIHHSRSLCFMLTDNACRCKSILLPYDLPRLAR